MNSTMKVKTFPREGAVVAMPRLCPGSEDHPAHPYVSHAIITESNPAEGYIIVTDDRDFDAIKIYVEVHTD